MISLRTYQCLDRDEPESRRYLAVVAASGIVMNFTGPTALDAQAKADGWLQAEREKAKTRAKGRAPGRAQP